jgi:hypothetical protein
MILTAACCRFSWTTERARGPIGSERRQVPILLLSLDQLLQPPATARSVQGACLAPASAERRGRNAAAVPD